MDTQQLEHIPAELKERPQWVCWHTEWRADQKTGELKPTKLPINARTGALASTTDPTTWTAFDEAVAAANQFDGIGFVFTEDDPYVGVDLDHCRDPHTGEIATWAWEIIRLLDSYTEVSPSGRGVHIICKGTLPPGGRRKGRFGADKLGVVEMYELGRYFTVTAEGLGGDFNAN